MELTVVLVSFLDDLTLLSFTSSSRSNAWADPIVRWREHAVARALLCQLALLADHTGATDTATWREQDWQADTEWFRQHNWPDWDDWAEIAGFTSVRSLCGWAGITGDNRNELLARLECDEGGSFRPVAGYSMRRL